MRIRIDERRLYKMNLETQQCIAENLKYLRNFYGYTQDQVADFLHVARSTYTLLESGRKIPRADLLIGLSQIYHVRIDVLLETNRKKFVHEVTFVQGSNGDVIELMNLYYQLSPFAQGCLYERAEMLLDMERREKMQQLQERKNTKKP